MSLLSGITGFRELLEGPRPDYVFEPECGEAAADDGAMGDSNSVRCNLPPGHDGLHWDSAICVYWTAEVP